MRGGGGGGWLWLESEFSHRFCLDLSIGQAEQYKTSLQRYVSFVKHQDCTETGLVYLFNPTNLLLIFQETQIMTHPTFSCLLHQ